MSENEIVKMEKELEEDKLINKLFTYVRDEIFPYDGTNDIRYEMNCYNIIYEYCNKGFRDEILEYHNQKLKVIITECFEKTKDLFDIDFINTFIMYTERLNFLFYSMSRIFFLISTSHLREAEDKNNVRIYMQDDISEFSMDIYKKYFFDKLQDKLFKILNELLIREERNGNMEYRQKIQKIIKIISDMDIIKPKINKIGSKSIIWKEMSKNTQNPPLTYQRKWFDNLLNETENYVKIKSENDIKNNTIPEYINNALTYITEEFERQSSYIKDIFHKNLNNINYKYLIKDKINKIIEDETGIKNMFKNNKKDELYGVYLLFNYYPDYPESLNELKNQFKEYIKERGLSLYNENNSPNIFIPELIPMKNEIDEFIELSFENMKIL